MAVAKIKTTDFATLLEPKHRQFFDQAYYDEVELQYPMFTKVTTMGKPTETYPHLGGFGLPESNTEGNTINEDTMSEGSTASLTVTRYDKGYDITHEMIKDDLQGVFGGAGKYGKQKVNNAPQMLGKSFRNREEVDAAKIYTEGFGNTGYDGVATFSASHPLADSASTKSNLQTGALTPDNLEDAITLMRTNSVDEANLISVVRPKKLLVPPALAFTAYKILGSDNEAFEISNTVNPIGGIQPMICDYFQQTGSTYASTNWFVYSDDVENAIFGWLEETFFEVQDIPRTIDCMALAVSRFATGAVNWRGIVGSTGV